MVKERILCLINNYNGKATLDCLAKDLEVSKDYLEKMILELRLDGKIFEHNNKYTLFPDGMLIGKISVTRSGNKVIFGDSGMIPVASNFFNSVILNDSVSFKINDKGEADITSIIDRKITSASCKVVFKGKKKKLECYYSGIEVELPKDIMDTFSDGDIISVNIGINDIDSKYCKCSFKGIIGHANDPNIDEKIIGENYGFHNNYSDDYMEEIAKIDGTITEKELAKRKDLRDLPFVTIDCVGAKDMDDGVYGYRFSGGYRIYVTIADVSHFVKFSSKIFERAYELGNSCYINNTVIHMLHSLLSNLVCSLNPDEDKLTKTVVMDIDKNGKIVDFDICKSVIRSRKKMDYTSVDKILVDNEIPSGYEEYVDTIRILSEAATALENNAVNVLGRVDFPSTENIKEYDEFGNVTKVTSGKISSSPSEKLIEYLMIAANQCVASYLLNCCMPSEYRVHKPASLAKVNAFLRELNDDKDINVDENGKKHKFKLLDSSSHPKAIQGLLKKLSNMNEYPIIASMLLQCMERAEYSVENIGHYALGLDVYTHFTSPIRRLCDLIVHMILDLLLADYEMIDKVDFDKMEEFLEEACAQASRMERQAEAAEYDGDRLAIIKSMQSHIGEEYDAVVWDVTDYIRIRVNGIDCFAKFKDLSDDFGYDDDSGKYYDKNNDKVLKLGATIKVKLKEINTNNRTIKVDILGVMDSKKLSR